jgi:hypothetical protein
MRGSRCRAAGIEVAGRSGCRGRGGETSVGLDVITAMITAEREGARVRGVGEGSGESIERGGGVGRRLKLKT